MTEPRPCGTLKPMERAAFEQLVHEAYLSLSEKFRNRINNVALLVSDEPTAEQRAQEGLADDETLLGLYQGIPNTARGDTYGIGPTLPDTVTLFQKPIEEAAAGDPTAIRKIVAETIWHEYAHYFGMDEDAVRRRGEELGHDV